jgi:adenylate cyclase
MAQRSEPTVQTFLFADLSGFIALTEAHGDEQAADLVGGFCAAVRQLLAAHQAQEVKTIGDALMLRTADAAAAIRLGLCLVPEVGAQHGFPLVRVGMHTGSAVERAGDWFGATVNLAARVSAAAAGGEALLTAATKTAAGDVAGVELRERGRWSFRNVGGLVEVYAAVRQGHAAPPGCRSTRCAGWRSTPGTVRAGSPTRAWSTASARLGAPVPSRRIRAATRLLISRSSSAPDRPYLPRRRQGEPSSGYGGWPGCSSLSGGWPVPTWPSGARGLVTPMRCIRFFI